MQLFFAHYYYCCVTDDSDIGRCCDDKGDVAHFIFCYAVAVCMDGYGVCKTKVRPLSSTPTSCVTYLCSMFIHTMDDALARQIFLLAFGCKFLIYSCCLHFVRICDGCFSCLASKKFTYF